MESIAFSTALLAGLISFISPCVLPLVPSYLCFIAGVSLDELTEERKTSEVAGRVLLSAVFFVLGFSTVFVALGATASFIGSFLASNGTLLRYIAGAIIILFGLHFLGVFKIGLFQKEARIHVKSKPVGPFGAYGIGLAFAFGWTPCIGPVLGAILAVAGAQDSVTSGAILLFVYSLGLGIPFLLAALFAGPFLKLMQKHKHHMGKVEKITGVLLILTGIMFLTNSIQTLAFLMLDWFPALAEVG